MKKVVLGILLTCVAGFIGLMSGVLIAEVVSPHLIRQRTGSLGVVVTAVPWYASWVMIGLPTLGTMTGVILGWILILKMQDPAHEAGHCSRCGYDLRKLVSTQCPECGELVPTWQQHKLAENDQTHA